MMSVVRKGDVLSPPIAPTIFDFCFVFLAIQQIAKGRWNGKQQIRMKINTEKSGTVAMDFSRNREEQLNAHMERR